MEYILCLFIVICHMQVIFSEMPIQEKRLPSFLKVCKRTDPNLKRCLKDSIESLRPSLAKGIPELDMPPIEPLIIPELIIDQGNGPVSVKSIYKDIEVYGPSSFVIKNVKVDLDKDKVKVKLYFPMLKINTNYTMEGRILMLPISGSGKSYGNYSNVESTLSIKTQKIEKAGNFYYDIKDFDVDFNIAEASLRFDNLFNGDTELGEHMNLFLNDNWETVAEEIKPALEDTIAVVFKKLSNKIFHKYPVKMLFPE